MTDPHEAMLNWARWAHSGERHDLDAKISSLWRFWLPHKHRDDGWGDPGAAEAMPDPIDQQAAEATDKALRLVPKAYYRVLRGWYYLHHRQDTAALANALQALEYVLDRSKQGQKYPLRPVNL